MPGDSGSELGRTRALVERTPAMAEAAAGTAAFAEEGAPVLDCTSLDARIRQSGARGQARYRLLGIEGIGATSRVYRAFDADLAREVAIKVLSAHGESEAADAFIAEARTTADLQHPNVLPVYELDAGARGELYFSMRRIVGRSLGDALGGDGRDRDPRYAMPLGANAVVGLFVQVCQALAYAHHRGIVHQDIKPDNIMLGDFGEVLLVDWGSASRLEDARPRLYGTPLYMSPEQARLERSTPASDIYCVGASLFHALYGRPPTRASSLDQLTARRARGEIDAPTPDERARVPAPLHHIALKALASTAAARYGSANELIADLQAYQGGLAIAAYPEPPWLRLWRWCRRNRRACWASATALAVVAVLLALLDAELAKRRASWRLVPDGDVDFSTIPPSQAERLLVARVKTADTPHLSFHEEPLAGSSHWSIAGGRLRLASDAEYVDVAWRGGMDGDFRAEWDYTPERNPLNLDCFVGEDRESGYTIHIGTYSDPRYAMLTRGSTESLDTRLLAEPLRVGRAYAFALERVGERLRLSIDGATIFDFVDRDPLAAVRATSFGLDCYSQRAQSVGRLRVLARAVPELVSPLAIGQALFQHGQWQEAVRCYDGIARAHSGTDLGLTAEASAALCLARDGDAEEGERRVRAFLDRAPDHAMALPILIEQEEFLRRHGDAAGVQAVRARLLRWRGEPLLRRVIQGLGEQYQPLLQPMPVRAVGDPSWPPGHGDRLRAAIADIRRWSDAYGMPLGSDMFVRDAVRQLAGLGRIDEAIAACPPDSITYAELLLDCGEYQQALDRFGFSPDIRARAWSQLERWRDIADDAEVDDDVRAHALLMLGRFDEAVRRYPRSPTVSNELLNEQRIDEYLAIQKGHEHDYERDMPWMCPIFKVMNARQQYQQALDLFASPICASTSLVGLGRIDEAMQRFPGMPWIAYHAAARALQDGDTARGVDLLRRASTYTLDATSDAAVSVSLLQALLPGFLGQPCDPPAALADILAHRRLWAGQRLWYLAALIAGRIDEAAFRAQPRKLLLEQSLHLALAMRADLAARADEAIREYKAALAIKGGPCGMNVEFVTWRRIALHDPEARPRPR